jgi:hypothetical protein
MQLHKTADGLGKWAALDGHVGKKGTRMQEYVCVWGGGRGRRSVARLRIGLAWLGSVKSSGTHFIRIDNQAYMTVNDLVWRGRGEGFEEKERMGNGELGGKWWGGWNGQYKEEVGVGSKILRSAWRGLR